jgi:hypothetical protein
MDAGAGDAESVEVGEGTTVPGSAEPGVVGVGDVAADFPTGRIPISVSFCAAASRREMTSMESSPDPVGSFADRASVTVDPGVAAFGVAVTALVGLLVALSVPGTPVDSLSPFRGRAFVSSVLWRIASRISSGRSSGRSSPEFGQPMKNGRAPMSSIPGMFPIHFVHPRKAILIMVPFVHSSEGTQVLSGHLSAIRYFSTLRLQVKPV